MVQLSQPYMTTLRNTGLTIGTFVGKVMSLLFNIVQVCYRFSSKEHVSFNFMAAVIIHSDFGAQENNVCHRFCFSPSICHETMGLNAMIFIFLNAEFYLQPIGLFLCSCIKFLQGWASPWKNENDLTHFSQFSSIAWSCSLFLITWTAACQVSLSITNSWGLFKLMSIESFVACKIDKDLSILHAVITKKMGMQKIEPLKILS